MLLLWKQPSPQVLKALTIQTLELNAKPRKARIYCFKKEITKELEISLLVDWRGSLRCFLLRQILFDPETGILSPEVLLSGASLPVSALSLNSKSSLEPMKMHSKVLVER